MRLDDALVRARAQGRPIVVPYLLVDRRRLGTLARTAEALRAAGAQALELGFPFSDPIADGPILEAAADRALAHGTDWTDLRAACRRTSPVLPTAVMTYANPIWRHGLSPALADLAGAGATGLIVPDLSLEEAPPWRRAAREARLSLVLLAAPGATTARVARIARGSRGFLYLVSRYGTTGRHRSRASIDLAPLVTAARGAAPRLPVLLGFGVRDAESAVRAMATGVDGVVIGTALEEAIARDPRPASVGGWLARVTRRIRDGPVARP